jgi:Fe-S cluster assembly protein SufD
MQTFTITQPGQTIRLETADEYQVFLTQPGAEVEIVGAFSLTGSDQQAVTVILHHQAPHTRATTTLHGVARDRSQLSFTGRIIIDPGCPDTNSFLTERILLLSDQAKATAVPDLEILSDDVKCSHAASISRIPEEHLFYLQSRGIPRTQAEEMIVDGFLAI